MTKSRGVRGAAGGCAVASLVYLLVRGLLTLLVSALMGLAHPGASLAKPLGFSGVSTALFQLLIGLGAIVLTLVFLLKVTRLKTKDLRIMLPAPWSPGFCLPVFLGVANLANLAAPRPVKCCPAAGRSCSCSFWRSASCPPSRRNCCSAVHFRG